MEVLVTVPAQLAGAGALLHHHVLPHGILAAVCWFLVAATCPGGTVWMIGTDACGQIGCYDGVDGACIFHLFAVHLKGDVYVWQSTLLVLYHPYDVLALLLLPWLSTNTLLCSSSSSWVCGGKDPSRQACPARFVPAQAYAAALATVNYM